MALVATTTLGSTWRGTLGNEMLQVYKNAISELSLNLTPAPSAGVFHFDTGSRVLSSVLSCLH